VSESEVLSVLERMVLELQKGNDYVPDDETSFVKKEIHHQFQRVAAALVTLGEARKTELAREAAHKEELKQTERETRERLERVTKEQQERSAQLVAASQAGLKTSQSELESSKRALAVITKSLEESEGMLLRLTHEKGLLMDQFQAEMVSF